MGDLNLLGADGTGLADQYITLRVMKIDAEKLRRKIAGSGAKDAAVAAGLSMVDSMPKMALDIGVPYAIGMLKDFGIEAKVVVSNVPPSQGGRSVSEFWPGLAVGGGLVGAGYGLYRLIRWLW